MSIVRRSVCLLALAFLVGCSRGPSRAEALAAIRSARKGMDSGTVYGRVWQDGPAWFSCAEVIAKFATARDSAVVRNQVGNWRSLIMDGWIVLRDSAQAIVSDPGWCSLSITPAGKPNVARWAVAPGPVFPTGQPRRGWTMPIGRKQLQLSGSPKASSKDAATAEFIVTVATNPDGTAIRADRDTARFIAELARVDGVWRATATRSVQPPAR